MRRLPLVFFERNAALLGEQFASLKSRARMAWFLETLSGSLSDTGSTVPQASSLFDQVKSAMRLSFDNYPTSLGGVMGPLLRTFVPACQLVRIWGPPQHSVGVH